MWKCHKILQRTLNDTKFWSNKRINDFFGLWRWEVTLKPEEKDTSLRCKAKATKTWARGGAQQAFWRSGMFPFLYSEYNINNELIWQWPTSSFLSLYFLVVFVLPFERISASSARPNAWICCLSCWGQLTGFRNTEI